MVADVESDAADEFLAACAQVPEIAIDKVEGDGSGAMRGGERRAEFALWGGENQRWGGQAGVSG